MTEDKKLEETKRIFKSDALKAMRGNMLAQRNLAIAYTNGLGVEQNYRKGFLWIKKSVNNPTGIPILHARAQSLLGWYYWQGQGTDKDYSEALHLFQLSAKRDCLEAQMRLGHLYFLGHGVEKCYDSALFWYRKARKLGSKHAIYHIGEVYAVSDFREFNQRKAIRYFQEGADLDCQHSQNRLGEIYLFGLDITKNIVQAKYWLLKSSELGNDSADYNLGRLHYKEKQYELAIHWFTKSAQQGNVSAQYSLGCHNEHGLGTNVSIYEAAIWYKKAATKGHSNAKKKLDKLIFKNKTHKENRDCKVITDTSDKGHDQRSEKSKPIINWSSLLSDETKNYFGLNKISTAKDTKKSKILIDVIS